MRRHKALELKIAGHSDRAIARILDVDVSTAHRDVKNVLEALAREHEEQAASLRSLFNARYEALFRAYYDQAIAGDTEAAKICVGILERIAKINGVIPDRSLVTVDQRAMKFDQPVTFNIDPGVTGIDDNLNFTLLNELNHRRPIQPATTPLNRRMTADIKCGIGRR